MKKLTVGILNIQNKNIIHCYAEDYVLGDNNLYVIEDNKIEKKLEGIEYYINIPEDDVYYKSIYES